MGVAQRRFLSSSLLLTLDFGAVIFQTSGCYEKLVLDGAKGHQRSSLTDHEGRSVGMVVFHSYCTSFFTHTAWHAKTRILCPSPSQGIVAEHKPPPFTSSIYIHHQGFSALPNRSLYVAWYSFSAPALLALSPTRQVRYTTMLSFRTLPPYCADCCTERGLSPDKCVGDRTVFAPLLPMNIIVHGSAVGHGS